MIIPKSYRIPEDTKIYQNKIKSLNIRIGRDVNAGKNLKTQHSAGIPLSSSFSTTNIQVSYRVCSLRKPSPTRLDLKDRLLATAVKVGTNL
ncbi:MAG: hypothetical protein AUG17_04370 [Crenarchaeota archaeon 13_1_20CM_2_53_14]|nr:MAG: hypothetical protein AUG17_04370 [Crenarchaeota archaeon 13_1_20CM_2_53_14]